MTREMARARRTGQPLIVAYLDVDGLKTINDSLGHAAGDTTLLRVANALQAGLRSYDVIIRYGGDEFVCVITGLSMIEAEERFERINTDLAGGAEYRSITVGLAPMQPDDTPEGLVARADAALYGQRHTA
jgi:diguanylate cyclase (GGDEF)-like protein